MKFIIDVRIHQRHDLIVEAEDEEAVRKGEYQIVRFSPPIPQWRQEGDVEVVEIKGKA